MTIRPVTADERLAMVFPLQSYAFAGSPADTDGRAELPYHEGNHTLAVCEDEQTLAVASAIPMWQNVRGRVLGMAGVAWVATHPSARRQGHSTALMLRLLGDMRDRGHQVSGLYPFRPSFYQRLGYVTLPKPRTVRFDPADLRSLRDADLPGQVTWQRVADGFAAYREFQRRLLAARHGYAVEPDYRAVGLRDRNDRWLATARVGDEVVGVLTYRIDGYGGTLVADDLLTTGPLGRALLLRFLAGHAGQVSQVEVTVAADESPELWAADLAASVETRIAFPRASAPMGRILAVDALRDMASGPGVVGVEVVDDHFLAGRYRLDGTGGRLAVDTLPERSDVPVATLTAAGLSALAFGVYQPEDVVVRGFGVVPPAAVPRLRALFPPCTPYLFGPG